MNGKRFPMKYLMMGIMLVFPAGCRNMDRQSADHAHLWNQENSSTPKPHQAAEIHVALGRSFEAKGKPAQAMAKYEEAIRMDRNQGEAHLRLAVLHDQQGNFDRSTEHYRRALQIRPGNADIYCNMGYSQYLQRRWAEAEMNLQQAVALQPDHQRAHNNLGLLFARTDRLAEALAEFRRGGCTEADAHNNVALALATEGLPAAAKPHYQTALASNPDSPTAMRGLQSMARIEQQRSAQPEALEVEAPDEIQLASHISMNHDTTDQEKTPVPVESAKVDLTLAAENAGVVHRPVESKQGTFPWTTLGIGVSTLTGLLIALRLRKSRDVWANATKRISPVFQRYRRLWARGIRLNKKAPKTSATFVRFQPGIPSSKAT